MQFSQYRFKFYLNASHAIIIDGQLGQTHPHTWELNLTTLKIKENFVSFHLFEEKIENLLSPYRDVLLNRIPPFDTLNPTLENIAGHLKTLIQNLLSKNDWLLLTLELSETPTRSYIISIIDELSWEAAQTPPAVQSHLCPQERIDDAAEKLLSRMQKTSEK